MKITHYNAPFEYVKVENMYDDAELADIYTELTYFHKSKLMRPPEMTGSAVDEESRVTKKNKAIFLDTLYQDRYSSLILRRNRKLFTLDLPYHELSSYFNVVKTSTKDTTLISYYEDSDYYKPHRDISILTALTYFYAEPKRFSGGELEIPRYGVSLEPTNNVTYIFCGQEMHAVAPITMDKDDLGKNLGRYCMAQFINFE
jgi:hypothetical protein